jgi:CHASE2 domain-containing sensor protein
VTYLLALLRYSLIALIVYVIFVYLHIPLVSMLVGLCALGAAAIAASVYEIFRPVK